MSPIGDELPSLQTVEGKPRLIVPYSLTTNDGKYANFTGHADRRGAETS